MATLEPLQPPVARRKGGAFDRMSGSGKVLCMNHVMPMNCATTQQAEEMKSALYIRVGGEANDHANSHTCDIKGINTTLGGNRHGNAIDVSNTSNGGGNDVILETPLGPPPPPHHRQHQHQRQSFLELSDPMHSLQISADELARDAMLERQQIEDDIHGTRSLVEETEEFICAKLEDVETELSNIASKRGYEMALELNPEYAGGRPMREMFLRSAAYDSQRAAQKLTQWFDAILSHFGVEALGRPLRLTDLTPEAYHILMIGKFQLLPTPDAAGRAVMVIFKNTVDTHSTCAIVQVLLYIASSTYGCDDLQRQGVITVHKFDVMPGTPKEHINPYMYRCGHMTHLMPVRLEAFHYISNQKNDRVESAADKFQHSVAGEIRNRFLIHLESTYQNSLHQLSTFGVPIKDLPFVDSAGDILISDHMHWVTKRKIAEGCGILAPNSIMRSNNCNLDQLLIRTCMTKAATCHGKSRQGKLHTIVSETESCTTVSDEEASTWSTATATTHVSGGDKTDDIVPTDCDVLMGRGRRFLRHPANQFLRTLVIDKSREYDKASRAEKYDIAKEIVAAIHKKEGRFLKTNPMTGLWFEVAWGVARDKVAHAFRKRRELDLAKARKAQAKQ